MALAAGLWMTLQQHGNAACRSCSVLEASRTNSIFLSSVGSTGKAVVEGWELAGGWKAGSKCCDVLLCIPEAGKKFQEKLTCLGFLEKIYFLDFCDFEAPIMNICNISRCFYSCSSEKHLSFKMLLHSSLLSLSSNT